MQINPDKVIYFKAGFFVINQTIACTWFVMAVLLALAWLATRSITSGPAVSRWQGLLETAVELLRGQIFEVMKIDPKPYLPYLGTLFLFIFVSNILESVPLYHAPTGSLSTTAALAVSVFVAVPAFGIMRKGLVEFLKNYTDPSIFMLPFNVISELSRTVSLAVRLFGNIMSGALISGILLMIVPLFVPVVMQFFGLLIGTVQAYIFFTLATVFIGSAVAASPERSKINGRKEGK